jgi:phosphatidylglycerol:prolipoprotein diacylglycerol transferase
VGLLGAKLFLFITEFDFYSSHPDQIISLARSAGTFYGGLIFGILFSVWFIRRHRLDFKQVSDVLSPGVALAQFFGRLGCFFAGCCYGRKAQECAIAIKSLHPDELPRFPTQLIESILNLLNFVVLFLVYKKKKFNGLIFVLYIFNYSIIRFVVEFFRGDDDRGYIFGGMEHPFTSLSVPQFISILGIITSIILYKNFKSKHIQNSKV